MHSVYKVSIANTNGEHKYAIKYVNFALAAEDTIDLFFLYLKFIKMTSLQLTLNEMKYPKAKKTSV